MVKKFTQGRTKEVEVYCEGAVGRTAKETARRQWWGATVKGKR